MLVIIIIKNNSFSKVFYLRDNTFQALEAESISDP